MTGDIEMELMHAFRKAARKTRMPGMRKGMRPEGRHPGMHHHGPHGMPGAHLPREIILSLILDREEQGVHQKDLTQELHINPSSVSESITKLEENGYLLRKTDPDDHRATLLVLTELGRARALEIQDQRKERMNLIFGNLSEEEKQQLLTLLNRMIED